MPGRPEDNLTPEDLADLKALRDRPDDKIVIDEDAPEIRPDAVGYRGILARRPKASITMRVDADVLEYFRAKAGLRGYQTMMNAALRRQMEWEIERARTVDAAE
ncbi:hypothetical protein HHL28_06075 [Aerophototrophica crusticola]|uniref:BrnA antitoxin of type II toxin-antitoxin system n=1 Tax=Aerophototrophica crusticola TaxID=1709002 RepID=A0A858R5Q1_9PROT|nr:hypothetical protein HHL28_06075 [Rhodospirillaceae bacterium B3]